MPLIAPLSLLLGLLAIPIVLLYMLRLRRREVTVSSTMLWRRLLQDKEANTPWQRLRRHLLLFIQLAILALLVFALARPYLPVSSVATGNVVVLLDGSASMLASEGDTERFALAVEEVNTLIDDLPANSQMTLILVGNSPRVLVSGSQDRPSLRQALAQAKAGPAHADWPSAMALAVGAAQGFQDAQVVLVSDGGVTPDLPALPVDLIYVPVGSATENLAISALASRDSPDDPQLFASVTNYGALPQQALVNIALDGELFDSRRVDVPAGEVASLNWAIPPGASIVGANLTDITQDQLAIDNQAWTVHESGSRKRVMLVTESNRFLETALSVLPGLDVFKINPDDQFTENNTGDLDLLVFDSVPVPENTLDAEILVVGPQKVTWDQDNQLMPAFTTGGVFTNTNIIRLEDSPLLKFVDWSAVNVRAAIEVDAPWARSLVEAEGGPLLLAGEHDGHRIVIVTFRLQDSDLPLQIAFPIVMANIMDWLDPGGSAIETSDFAPGEPVRLGVVSGADTIVVREPNGVLWTATVDDTPMVFPDTEQPGVYEVLVRNADGERLAGHFTVNLNDAVESGIAPVDSVRINATTTQTASENRVGQREFWPWIALFALIVLMVEWWVYHRGTRFPDRDDWNALTRRHGE